MTTNHPTQSHHYPYLRPAEPDALADDLLLEKIDEASGNYETSARLGDGDVRFRARMGTTCADHRCRDPSCHRADHRARDGPALADPSGKPIPPIFGRPALDRIPVGFAYEARHCPGRAAEDGPRAGRANVALDWYGAGVFVGLVAAWFAYGAGAFAGATLAALATSYFEIFAPPTPGGPLVVPAAWAAAMAVGASLQHSAAALWSPALVRPAAAAAVLAAGLLVAWCEAPLRADTLATGSPTAGPWLRQPARAVAGGAWLAAAAAALWMPPAAWAATAAGAAAVVALVELASRDASAAPSEAEPSDPEPSEPEAPEGEPSEVAAADPVGEYYVAEMKGAHAEAVAERESGGARPPKRRVPDWLTAHLAATAPPRGPLPAGDAPEDDASAEFTNYIASEISDQVEELKAARATAGREDDARRERREAESRERIAKKIAEVNAAAHIEVTAGARVRGDNVPAPAPAPAPTAARSEGADASMTLAELWACLERGEPVEVWDAELCGVLSAAVLASDATPAAKRAALRCLRAAPPLPPGPLPGQSSLEHARERMAAEAAAPTTVPPRPRRIDSVDDWIAYERAQAVSVGPAPNETRAEWEARRAKALAADAERQREGARAIAEAAKREFAHLLPPVQYPSRETSHRTLRLGVDDSKLSTQLRVALEAERAATRAPPPEPEADAMMPRPWAVWGAARSGADPTEALRADRAARPEIRDELPPVGALPVPRAAEAEGDALSPIGPLPAPRAAPVEEAKGGAPVEEARGEALPSADNVPALYAALKNKGGRAGPGAAVPKTLEEWEAAEARAAAEAYEAAREAARAETGAARDAAFRARLDAANPPRYGDGSRLVLRPRGDARAPARSPPAVVVYSDSGKVDVNEVLAHLERGNRVEMSELAMKAYRMELASHPASVRAARTEVYPRAFRPCTRYTALPTADEIRSTLARGVTPQLSPADYDAFFAGLPPNKWDEFAGIVIAGHAL